MKNNLLFNIYSLIFVSIVVLTLPACIFSSDVEYSTMEILSFEEQENESKIYPKYLQDILQPIENTCEKRIFGFEPTRFFREDLGEEFVIDYLNKKARNPKKVKAAIRMLKEYFEENEADLIFSKPSINQGKFEAFLEATEIKENHFFFTTNRNAKLEGHIVYNNIENLRKSIGTYLCNAPKEETTSVMIIILPKKIANESPSPPNNNNTIQEAISDIANRKEAEEDRLKKAHSFIANQLEVGAKVVEVSPDNTPINGTVDGFPLVKDWLQSLSYSRTIEKVEVKEVKRAPEGDRIRELTVIEYHRGDTF